MDVYILIFFIRFKAWNYYFDIILIIGNFVKFNVDIVDNINF